MVINCTPHDVAVYRSADCCMYYGCLYLREGDTEPLCVYPAAKKPAHAIYVQRTAGLADGDLIDRLAPREIISLPGPKPYTYYIVSKLLAKACPEKEDLIFPGTLVRDESGDVVGCTVFYRV